MVDSILIFFFKNTMFVSLVFFLLTLAFQFFFKRYEYKFREDFYECGFKTTTDIGFTINYSFFLSAIFLLLYDIEFVFTIPYFFNLDIFNTQSIFYIIFFFFIIFITLVADIFTDTIE